MDSFTSHFLTAVLSFAGALGLKALEPKSKVMYALVHDFAFNFQANSQSYALRTHAMLVQNFGRAEATDIEIVHKHKPDVFHLFPSRVYTESQTPAGEHVVRIASLASKEHFYIEFLSYTRLPEFLYIRSNAGLAKQIATKLQKAFPPYVEKTAGFLVLTGAATIIYLLIRILMLLSGHPLPHLQ